MVCTKILIKITTCIHEVVETGASMIRIDVNKSMGHEETSDKRWSLVKSRPTQFSSLESTPAKLKRGQNICMTVWHYQACCLVRQTKEDFISGFVRYCNRIYPTAAVKMENLILLVIHKHESVSFKKSLINI